MEQSGEGSEYSARMSSSRETPQEPARIAGPVAQPSAPREWPPPNAWDAHAHIFGPPSKFPYTAGRGYTPPDAPVERYMALLDHLGFTYGLLVQGNAHGFDNRARSMRWRAIRGGCVAWR